MLILSTLAHGSERTYVGSLTCRVASQAERSRTLACIFEPLGAGGNRAYSASITHARINLPRTNAVTIWSVFAARQRSQYSLLSGTYSPTVSGGREALIGGLRNRFVLLPLVSGHGPSLEINRMVLQAIGPRA